MIELKAVLDNLHAGMCKLQDLITEYTDKINKIELEKKKIAEITAKQTATANDLNEREIKVKEIESIIDYSNKAKVLMKEAKDLFNSVTAKEKTVNDDRAKLNQEKTEFASYKENEEIGLKNQADALIKGREELRMKLAAAKTVSKVLS